MKNFEINLEILMKTARIIFQLGPNYQQIRPDRFSNQP